MPRPVISILLTFFFFLILATASTQELDSEFSHTGIQKTTVCEPVGACERCPEYELDKQFCQPFGNRQLLHCRDPESEGKTPTWGPCGRIVHKEATDFFEFLACNVGFAVVGLLAVIARSRQLAFQRARHLSARIGISRSLVAAV